MPIQLPLDFSHPLVLLLSILHASEKKIIGFMRAFVKAFCACVTNGLRVKTSLDRACLAGNPGR